MKEQQPLPHSEINKPNNDRGSLTESSGELPPKDAIENLLVSPADIARKKNKSVGSVRSRVNRAIKTGKIHEVFYLPNERFPSGRKLFLRSEDFDILDREIEILLPDGTTIPGIKSSIQEQIINMLIAARSKGENIDKEKLLTGIVQFQTLDKELAIKRLDGRVGEVKKKLKPLGWHIKYVEALDQTKRGLTLVNQEELETKFYRANDVQFAAGINSLRTAQDYVSQILERDRQNGEILLSEEDFESIVSDINSKRRLSSREELLFFPDGSPTPYLSEAQRKILQLLIQTREEKRPLYMQEAMDLKTFKVPDSSEGKRFRGSIYEVKKKIKKYGWTIESSVMKKNKGGRGRSYYFLRKEKETASEIQNLLEILEIKDKIIISSSLIVLENFATGQKTNNINLLLYNATVRNYPNVKMLTDVFENTSPEKLKNFFIHGFIYTLERSWYGKYPENLSEEEKEIMASCNRLKQIGWDTQKIINFAKTHFSIPTQGDKKLSA